MPSVTPTAAATATASDHPQDSNMDTMGDDQRYFSNESLEDRGSTTSSTEGMSNIERRKDHEFIPTRMKQISASRPAQNPQQFTRVTSNPLLISAQKQMLMAEEIKKAKETVRQTTKRFDEEPEWQGELSTWKDRRRKQSEDALMRVAEISALSSDNDEERLRKMSLGKKFSGLLHNDDDDWTDLGLERPHSGPSNRSFSKDRSSSASPPALGSIDEKDVARDLEGYEESKEQSLERWTSSSSVTNSNQSNASKRKSSEVSTGIKSRLEAFQVNRRESEERRTPIGANEEEQQARDPEQFRKKLENFRKISQTELSSGGTKASAAKGGEGRKPPPPLSYSQLIEPQHYQSSSALRRDSDSDNDFDANKLLEDALEESYRSVLEETPKKKSSDVKVFHDQDLRPDSSLTPPSERPPPPPASSSSSSTTPAVTPTSVKRDAVLKKLPSSDQEDIDRQERAIIEGLELEEREHKKYMDTIQSMRALATSDKSAPSAPTSAPAESMESKSKPVVQQPGKAAQFIVKPKSDPIQAPPVPVQTKKKDSATSRSYNQHWLIQEAEQRRIAEMQNRTSSSMTPSPNSSSHSPPIYENNNVGRQPRPVQAEPVPQPQQHSPIYSNSDYISPPMSNVSPKGWGQQQPQFGGESLYANLGPKSFNGPPSPMHTTVYPARDNTRIPGPQVPPRNNPESKDRMLSVSGKKKCSHCKDELGRGAAMIIESLRLFYHLKCFKCCVCNVQLGNGSTGTDVRVRNNKLHCQNCYSNDEGLKFSKV